MDKVYKPIKVYLIRKKNWFIFDKNDIDKFFFKRLLYTQGVGECRVTADHQRMH